VRFIRLDALEDADVLHYSGREVKVVLRAEMRKSMLKDEAMMYDKAHCIYDIISDSSNDAPLGYFINPKTIDTNCNERKQTQIKNWVSNVEAPNHVHANLYNKEGEECGALEPKYDCPELIWAEIVIESKIWLIKRRRMVDGKALTRD
jgi:hypothetical protein